MVNCNWYYFFSITDSIAEEFRTSTGINISSKDVQQELHGKSFRAKLLHASFVQCQVSDGVVQCTLPLDCREVATCLMEQRLMFLCLGGFGGCWENITFLTTLCQL